MSDTVKMIDIAASTKPNYEIEINNVGIKRLTYPAIIPNQGTAPVTFDMNVNLPASVRGTHMSRFIEVLNEKQWEITAPAVAELTDLVSKHLDASECRLEAKFTAFIEKEAPASKIKSMMDYQVAYISKKEQDKTKTYIQVVVPVKTLCPCSKAISKYGAHNQRANLSVLAELQNDISLKSLIETIESCGSAPLYSLLKRQDEQYITELAYEQAKFVEDSARELADKLTNTPEISEFCLEIENFESIHNHSAYARIKTKGFTTP